MPDWLGFAVLCFTSLLAIVNPLGAVPIYVAMTASYAPRQRRNTVRRAMVTSLVTLVAFALFGTWILQFFGITTQAFQIAGGIIFFGMGWDMLNVRRTRVKTTEEEETESAAKEDVGIIPLGLPTLVGPGAITTVIALNGQADSAGERAGVYAAIVFVLLISWGLLAAAPAVTRRIGTTGMNVMTRLMGLIVMVVGAQFVINGVTVVAVDILSRTA
ncbi:MAG: NAAT family transporter [Gemmatimonadetes bacterium]|nr:NAAT family transporter [Gemmatimonadota bacterium]